MTSPTATGLSASTGCSALGRRCEVGPDHAVEDVVAHAASVSGTAWTWIKPREARRRARMTLSARRPIDRMWSRCEWLTRMCSMRAARRAAGRRRRCRRRPGCRRRAGTRSSCSLPRSSLSNRVPGRSWQRGNRKRARRHAQRRRARGQEGGDVRLRRARAQGPEFAFGGFGNAQAHGPAAGVNWITRGRGVGATGGSADRLRWLGRHGSRDRTRLPHDFSFQW